MIKPFSTPHEVFTGVDRYLCQYCPPERMCPWDCVQGASVMDVIIETHMAQEKLADWPLSELDPRPGHARMALMETYR